MEILTKEPYVTERAGHKQVQTDADLFTKYTPKKKPWGEVKKEERGFTEIESFRKEKSQSKSAVFLWKRLLQYL